MLTWRKALFYSLGIMNAVSTEMTNVRLPHELKARAKSVADVNGISLSDIVRMALMAELAAVEAGKFRLRRADEPTR